MFTCGSYAVNAPPNLRREVLKLAVRHYRALSEEFLEKLKAQKLEAANNVKAQTPGNLNDALSQRLGVARELLQAGEAERALQFAEPALTVAHASFREQETSRPGARDSPQGRLDSYHQNLGPGRVREDGCQDRSRQSPATGRRSVG